MPQINSKVNPPVEQEFDTFILNGGLDLTTPKALTEKGTLLDCSNREVVDLLGYKVVDGFDKYDGSIIAQDEFYYVITSSYAGTLSTDFPVGSLLINKSISLTDVFGKVVQTTTVGGNPAIVYARINEANEPDNRDFMSEEPGSVSQVSLYTNPSLTFNVSTLPQKWSSQASENAREVVDSYNTWNASLRSDVSSIFANDVGDQPPIADGLHWFRDKLYAVATNTIAVFEQTSGTDEILPNYIMENGSGSEFSIIDIQLAPGTSFAAGDAVGILQLKWLKSPFNLDVLSPTTNITISEPSSLNTVISLTAYTKGSSNGLIPQYASLWKSLSEQQSIDENSSLERVGWVKENMVDMGWEFGFENGYSTSGDLVKVERSRTNNFDFQDTSSPDNYSEESFNGSNVDQLPFAPNSLSPIGNLVENGFPGWKSSASSSVFATDETLHTAISAASGTTAYANIWYRYDASRGNIMFARDKDILGPVNEGSVGTNLGGPAIPSAGAVTLDSDWYSTQARAPIILKNFAGAFTAIPTGAVLTGIKVDVSYTTRHYALGMFQENRITDTQFRDAIITATTNTPKWGAAVVQVDNGNLAASSIYGTPQYTPVTIETDSADYTLQTSASGGIAVHRMAQTAVLSGLSSSIGGTGNVFGLANLSREFWIDQDIGIAVFGQIDVSPSFSQGLNPFNPSGTTTRFEQIEGQIRLNVDEIKVTFYYTNPSARYFVGDGAGNVCSIDVVYTLTTDGTWESRSATGKIQGNNLVPDLVGAKRFIADNDRLYLTSSAAAADTGFANGTSIATVSSDMTYNGLPSLQRLLSNKSRYEFITANFYANEEWDGIYGVSGAGKAFSYYTFDSDDDGSNEDYFINIYTNSEDTESDIPRHIAYHHNSLALGYSGGVVRFSVPGEPENFSGIDGAAEIGVGDRVTGLLSMRGTTLGVFCENSTWGIAGTDADNYQTTVLSPYTGAIEYTVVDMGIPVYCNSSGVSTLEQSEKYGNFLGQRLSAKVSPFVLPRMVKESDQFIGDGVVCAIPVRTKNQYRVFFKDGKVLSMTIGPDGSSSFTFSNYYIGQTTLTDTNLFVVPFAWSSQIDEKGKERIHFSHYSPKSDIVSGSYKFVYEMDVGWSFSGKFIPSHYTVNWFNQNPFTYSTIRNYRVDGLTHGVSSCKLTCAKDYDTTFSSASVDISLPRDATDYSYSTSVFPVTNMAHIAERGRNISLKISSEVPSGDSVDDPIPPDVHQIAFIQYGPGGIRDS